MQVPFIDDELWTLIEPLLPLPKARRKKNLGRSRISDRAALNGVFWVLTTGLRWNQLPTRLGFGSGATCWRRLRDWQESGLWDQLHKILIEKLLEAGKIDISHVAIELSSIRACRGNRKNGCSNQSYTTDGS